MPERHSEPGPVHPELFIGLVAAVGTDHDQLCSIVEETLRSFGYRTFPVRLTTLLRSVPRFKHLKTTPVDEYIRSHQKAGDEFREAIGQQSALASLGITLIRDLRKQQSGEKDRVAGPSAYLIRSLKTPEEVKLLREVYGNAFILIASSAPYNVRRRYLAAQIAQSRHEFQQDKYLSVAEELIQADQEEEGNTFGQNLKNAFHLADIFVDTADVKRLREAINRCLELVFGNTFHTPTRDEYGMFHALAASLRSSELGRQVGAAVSTTDGDIVAVGTNEVPRAGGGLYWSGDEPDHREFVKGEDSSDVHKRSFIEDLLNRLRDDGWLHPDKSRIEISTLAEMATDPSRAKHFSSARVTDLIEFGRAAHAEMAAIADAARRGVPIAGTTMYVTTFPCHLCARIIVASGIARVVYIEPYTKSLALQLYPDSITADYNEQNPNLIPFEPFVGVAPRKYIELFTMLRRKDKRGKAIPFEKSTAVPRMYGLPSSYLAREIRTIGELELIIEQKQMMNEQQELPHA
jgi:deoxycytidylate deaminase